MADAERSVDVYRCRVCGEVHVGTHRLQCCDRPMQPARALPAVEPPTTETLLRTVFGMSTTELEVCLCAMESGEATAAGLADELGVDRSLVSRHLNHLAALGVLEKGRRLLRHGGHVNVYTPVDVEDVRRRLALGLSAWVRDATELVEEVSKEKVERVVEVESASPRVYER